MASGGAHGRGGGSSADDDADSAVFEEARHVLRALASSSRLNLVTLDSHHLALLLPRLLPQDWRPNRLQELGLDEVPWVPSLFGSSSSSKASSSSGGSVGSNMNERSITAPLDGRERRRSATSGASSVNRLPPPSEEWITCLWDFLCGSSGDNYCSSGGSSSSSSGSGSGSGSGSTVNNPQGAKAASSSRSAYDEDADSSSKRVGALATAGWPVLPCFRGGPGMRVLRPLRSIKHSAEKGTSSSSSSSSSDSGTANCSDSGTTGVGVICPRLSGAKSDTLPPAVATCLALAGVAVVDGALLGSQVLSSPALAEYCEPPAVRGVLRAIFAPLGHGPPAQSSISLQHPQGKGTAGTASRGNNVSMSVHGAISQDHNVSSDDAVKLEVRFKACQPNVRDALRNFLKDPANLVGEFGSTYGGGGPSGAIPADLVPYIQVSVITSFLFSSSSSSSSFFGFQHWFCSVVFKITCIDEGSSYLLPISRRPSPSSPCLVLRALTANHSTTPCALSTKAAAARAVLQALVEAPEI